MSVSSVRAEMTRVVREAFENNNGEIDAEGMKAVIDEAKAISVGLAGILEAVLQPGAYLDGFDLTSIRFTAEAYKLAGKFGSGSRRSSIPGTAERQTHCRRTDTGRAKCCFASR